MLERPNNTHRLETGDRVNIAACSKSIYAGIAVDRVAYWTYKYTVLDRTIISQINISPSHTKSSNNDNNTTTSCFTMQSTKLAMALFVAAALAAPAARSTGGAAESVPQGCCCKAYSKAFRCGGVPDFCGK
jgi:hypothetical protein